MRKPGDLVFRPVLAGFRAVDADIARAQRLLESPRPLAAPGEVVGAHHETEGIEAPQGKKVVRPHGAYSDIVAEDEGDISGGLLHDVRPNADGDAWQARADNLLQGAGPSRNRDDEARDAVRDRRRHGLAGQLVLGRNHAEVPSASAAQIAEDAREDFPSGIAQDGEGRDDVAGLPPPLRARAGHAGTAVWLFSRFCHG